MRESRGCVALASEDCHVAAEPGGRHERRHGLVRLDVPAHGPGGEGPRHAEFQAVDLARRDFSDMLAGCHRPSPRQPPYRAPLVRRLRQPATARSTTSFDEVGVPAVIGFRSSNEAIDAATSTLIPKGVVGIAALNTSPMISSLPATAGRAAPHLADDVLGRRRWRSPSPSSCPRSSSPSSGRASVPAAQVALVRQDDATGLGFADALFRSLHFNDRSALENESNYREFVELARRRRRRGGVRRARRRSSPRSAPKSSCFSARTSRSSASPSRSRRAGATPIASALREDLAPRSGGPLVHRLERRPAAEGFSLTTVSTTPANARFVARYNEAFGDGVTRTFSPNSSYDAFYLVAYATYALGDAPVTGAASQPRFRVSRRDRRSMSRGSTSGRAASST